MAPHGLVTNNTDSAAVQQQVSALIVKGGGAFFRLPLIATFTTGTRRCLLPCPALARAHI